MIVVYDDLYTEHLRRVGHPESPDRVSSVAAHLERRGLTDRAPARDATDGELERVHPHGYIERVKRDVASVGERAGYLSTGDTVIDASSLAVARRAAGGALAAMELAVESNGAAFALVRPPGHHAEPARGMGFCVFGNAAVAARAYVATNGGRALVVDFDYHHGNGTQAVAGDGVSFVSTHAFPAYPGTGGDAEQRFDPHGAIVNVPLPPHEFGTEAFVALWQRLLPAVAARVRPDLIVVSAGYDFAAGEPVGDLGVDADVASSALAATIREVAETYASGRVAYCLEGGYDVATLCGAVEATLRAHDAAERTPAADAGALPPRQRRVLDAIDAWRI
ncbi:MAG: histone deacetylase [Candidatus Eremiobacteraeota bacterium]|nr:histone deacetylase [Candidatus Eremiobacteraeota bacterium]